jgi:hypothetical protein
MLPACALAAHACKIIRDNAPMERIAAIVVIATFSLLGLRAPVAVAGQLDLENLAMWPDGEIRSGYLELSKETVTLLRLLPSGPDGTLNLVIAARWPGKSPSSPPEELEVRADVGMGVNPLVMRRAELVFVLDTKGEQRVRVDLSERLRLADPGPAAAIERGTARLSIVEFIQLLRAEAVRGEIFGLGFSLTSKQIEALRKFGDTVLRRSP